MSAEDVTLEMAEVLEPIAGSSDEIALNVGTDVMGLPQEEPDEAIENIASVTASAAASEDLVLSVEGSEQNATRSDKAENATSVARKSMGGVGWHTVRKKLVEGVFIPPKTEDTANDVGKVARMHSIAVKKHREHRRSGGHNKLDREIVSHRLELMAEIKNHQEVKQSNELSEVVEEPGSLVTRAPQFGALRRRNTNPGSVDAGDESNAATEISHLASDQTEQGIKNLESLQRRTKLDSEKRIQLAARFIKDSLAHQAFLVESNAFQRVIHRFWASKFWTGFVFLIITVYMWTIAFYEPVSYRTDPEYNPYYFIALDAMFALFLSVDFVLNLAGCGLREFLKNFWNVVYGICILLTLICCGTKWATLQYCSACYYLQWSRPIRPVIVISRSSKIRDIFTTLLKTVPSLIDVSFLVILWLTSFAIAGVYLFRGRYDAYDYQFNNFYSAFVAIFVLWTTENYPDVTWGALEWNPLYSIFFVVFVAVAVFVLTTVVIALIFNAYRESRKAKLLSNRINDRLVLAAAFRFLDESDEKDDFINFETWMNLLKHIKPKVDDDYAKAIFTVVDAQEDRIDLMEFFELCDILLDDIEVEDTKLLSEKSFAGKIQHYFVWLYSSKIYGIIIFILLSINFAAMAVVYNPYIATSQWFWGCFLVNLAIATILLLEQFVKLLGLRPWIFVKSNWNWYDLILSMTGFVACGMVGVLKYYPEGFGDLYFAGYLITQYDGLFRASQALQVVILFRLITCSSRLQYLVANIMRLIPIMTNITLMVLIIIYVYAIIGMELFAGRTTPTDYVSPYHDFNSFFDALLVLFQLLTTSNWHTVMYAYAAVTGWWATVYFMSFYIIVVVLILNLVIALVLEQFEFLYDKSKAEETLLELNSDDKEENERPVEEGDDEREKSDKEKKDHGSKKYRRIRNTESALLADLDQDTEYDLLGKKMGLDFKEMRESKIKNRLGSTPNAPLLVTNDSSTAEITPNPAARRDATPMKVQKGRNFLEEGATKAGNSGDSSNWKDKEKVGPPLESESGPLLVANHLEWSGAAMLADKRTRLMDMTQLEASRENRRRARISGRTSRMRQ